MDIEYQEEIDESVSVTEVKIPPLILQPFVENALWHGLSSKDGKKSIKLSIKDQANWILCEIIDNGVGRKKAAETSKSFPEGTLSKAVQITTQRLADFNMSPEILPVRFIDLENEAGEPMGTKVIIHIKGRYIE